MKILFCAAEMASFVKVGGLADVTGGLTRALAQRGHDVRLIIPLYGIISRSAHNLRSTGITFTVSIKGKEEPAVIWTTKTSEGVQVYFVEHAAFFGTPEVYTPNDLDRFFYFSKASIESLKHLNWQPDILHCHDWHTGFTISYLKNDLRQDSFYDSFASVFTIHNLGYQGWFDYSWATAAAILHHIPPKDNPLHSLLWRMMGLAIYYSDLVSTVSETYAREILTPEYGEGIDPILRHRENQLYGIVNGIDYDAYDPSTDHALSSNFNIISVDKKKRAKQALQAEVGLPNDAEVPLLGYVGRFTKQKGCHLLADGVESLLAKTRVQLVALGQAPKGEEKYGKMLETLADRHPGQVKVIARFDDALSRRIYSGCDLFLMPSLYEPCGLGQLIALRYGTIPVVRHTGGLIDTVIEHPVMGNGFVFHNAYDGGDLEKALERTIYLFHDKERWRRLVIRAMSSDSSWERACQRYEDIYKRAIELHR